MTNKTYQFLRTPLSDRLKSIARTEIMEKLTDRRMVQAMIQASTIVRRIELNPPGLEVSWGLAARGVSTIEAALSIYLSSDNRASGRIAPVWRSHAQIGLCAIQRSGKLAPAEAEAQRLQLCFKFDEDTCNVCLGYVDLLDDEFRWVEVLRKPRESLCNAVSRVGEELRRRDICTE